MYARQLSFNFSSMVWGGAWPHAPPFGSAPGAYEQTDMVLHHTLNTKYFVISFMYIYKYSMTCFSNFHIRHERVLSVIIKMEYISEDGTQRSDLPARVNIGHV